MKKTETDFFEKSKRMKEEEKRFFRKNRAVIAR
jgi:hypothetical protein